jgi:hypothetical protein
MCSAEDFSVTGSGLKGRPTEKDRCREAEGNDFHKLMS